MQLRLQSSLLTFLDISKKSDFRKPASWPNICKNLVPNSIRLLADDRYPLGFIANITGGYSVNIDGVHYADYESSVQLSMSDWSDYTDTEGFAIDYPIGATKAHIIDIYPQTSGENVTAFHCARVAASGNEEQGILWAHFNLSNAINLSKGFAYTEYYNDLLMAVTAKKNTIIANGLDYCFDNALSLEYLPSIDCSNVSDMTNFITKASNISKIDTDISTNNNLTKIGIYGNSTYFINAIKSLRVSNQAPFTGTAPQINVSYTDMDRSALVQLFNDLPYNVGYTVSGSPTISQGVVSNFTGNDYPYIDNSIDGAKPIEYFTEFTTGTLSGNQELLAGIKSGGGYSFRVFIQGTNTLLIAYNPGTEGGGYLSLSYTFQNNTTYSLKISYNGDKTLVATVYNASGEQVATQTFTQTVTLLEISYLIIGTVGTGSSVWSGSINFNNTYIKVNGVYWFRGQAAMTKTLSCVGCTGTADLTADDKDIALDKGWSLTLE